MDYTYLGRTALKVSRLCLGTTNFGVHTHEGDSHAILDAALDAGLNFVDTANVYGYDQGRGKTELIIGRWLAKNRDKRDRLVLATKVYSEMSDDVNDQGLSAYHIRRACESSLRRLQTDHIDLYQMHHIDRHAPWEEVWQAMEQLVREGKISYVGSSNFAGWHIAQAQEAARQRHFLGLVSEQSVYNLTERMVELEVLPAAAHYGLGFIPYSPVGGGVLGGRGSGSRRHSAYRQKLIARYQTHLEQYEVVCRELNAHPAEVAVAWLLHQPHVTAPIIGPRTLEQLYSNLRALEVKLSPEMLQRLDAIWPGPGGAAPEAYAW